MASSPASSGSARRRSWPRALSQQAPGHRAAPVLPRRRGALGGRRRDARSGTTRRRTTRVARPRHPIGRRRLSPPRPRASSSQLAGRLLRGLAGRTRASSAAPAGVLPIWRRPSGPSPDREWMLSGSRGSHDQERNLRTTSSIDAAQEILCGYQTGTSVPARPHPRRATSEPNHPSSRVILSPSEPPTSCRRWIAPRRSPVRARLAPFSGSRCKLRLTD